MRQAYLFHLLPEFTTQLIPSTTALPKVYAAYPGIAYAVSRANQQDLGKRLEIAVFLELLRMQMGSRDESVASWNAPSPSRAKVDFVVVDALAQEPYQAIQVCVDMSASKTRQRELRGLEEVMRHAGLKRTTVITLEQEERIPTDAGTIDVAPAWHWSLERPSYY